MLSKLFKFIFKLILIALIVAIICNVAVFVITAPRVRSTPTDLAHAECVLVLGASVNEDGTLGEYLQNRMDSAISLYFSGYADKLLLSGDNGQVEYNEVDTMKNYALACGVPGCDIFLDHAGFSTYESMYRAKAIFNVQSAIVVTQSFHLNRALASGRILGIDVQGFAAADPETSVKYRAFLHAREFLARCKDLAMSLVGAEPTYLGDVIPITGDGRLSWD